jgi:hypothetical protein
MRRGSWSWFLEEVLEFKEWRLRSRVIRECLVRWRELPVEDATGRVSRFYSTLDWYCLRTSNLGKGGL